MSKFKGCMKKIGDKIMKALCLPDEYAMLGIYSKGEILVTKRPDQIFSQQVCDKFALIRNIEGEGRPVDCYLTAFNPSNVDCDLMDVADLSTWECIIDNGLADCVKDDEDRNPLWYVLTSRHPIGTEVFDFLWETYPNTDIKNVLWKCERLEAVKWACEHGADKSYNEQMIKHTYRERLDGKDIFEYLFGNNSDSDEI